jgi:hypothetical protein
MIATNYSPAHRLNQAIIWRDPRLYLSGAENTDDLCPLGKFIIGAGICALGVGIGFLLLGQRTRQRGD